MVFSNITAVRLRVFFRRCIADSRRILDECLSDFSGFLGHRLALLDRKDRRFSFFKSGLSTATLDPGGHVRPVSLPFFPFGVLIQVMEITAFAP